MTAASIKFVWSQRRRVKSIFRLIAVNPPAEESPCPQDEWIGGRASWWGAGRDRMAGHATRVEWRAESRQLESISYCITNNVGMQMRTVKIYMRTVSMQMRRVSVYTRTVKIYMRTVSMRMRRVRVYTRTVKI